jgi:hypothetical protein
MLPLLVGILQDALEFIETSVTGWNCVQNLDFKFKMTVTRGVANRLGHLRTECIRIYADPGNIGVSACGHRFNGERRKRDVHNFRLHSACTVMRG